MTTIPHLLLLILLLLLALLRLLVLVLLLEIRVGGRLPGGVLFELFLLFELNQVAFEAFEVAGGSLDEVFGLVGGFEGFEHGADLRSGDVRFHFFCCSWLHMLMKAWMLSVLT